MKTNIVVLYRGNSLADAGAVAATSNPQIVAAVCAALLKEGGSGADPFLRKVEEGRRTALRGIRDEALQEEDPVTTLRAIRAEALDCDRGRS